MGTPVQPCPLKLSCRGWDVFGAQSESRRVCKWEKRETSMTLDSQPRRLENAIFKHDCSVVLSEWLVLMTGKWAWFQAWALRAVATGPHSPSVSIEGGQMGLMCTQEDNSPWLICSKPWEFPNPHQTPHCQRTPQNVWGSESIFFSSPAAMRALRSRRASQQGQSFLNLLLK